MIISKLLTVVPVLFAGIALPGVAAPLPAPAQTAACLDQAAFLSALSDAGDWIIKRDPDGAVARVAFRESGMIDVAVFRDGCLAVVVVVGQARPDFKV
jgi:hypothetical protein